MYTFTTITANQSAQKFNVISSLRTSLQSVDAREVVQEVCQKASGPYAQFVNRMAPVVKKERQEVQEACQEFEAFLTEWEAVQDVCQTDTERDFMLTGYALDTVQEVCQLSIVRPFKTAREVVQEVCQKAFDKIQVGLFIQSFGF